MVTEQVTQFYRALPFNYEQTLAEACRTIQASNQIAAAYPTLDAILASAKQRVVLDVGCGAGWFVNTVAHYYGLEAAGGCLCEAARFRSRALSRHLPPGGRGRWNCVGPF